MKKRKLTNNNTTFKMRQKIQESNWKVWVYLQNVYK